jgi:hypothetical protein
MNSVTQTVMTLVPSPYISVFTQVKFTVTTVMALTLYLSFHPSEIHCYYCDGLTRR